MALRQKEKFFNSAQKRTRVFGLRSRWRHNNLFLCAPNISLLRNEAYREIQWEINLLGGGGEKGVGA